MSKRSTLKKPKPLIEGPFAFEACVYRFSDLALGALLALFAGAGPTEHDRDVMELTGQLVDRMRDQGLPKMLCMLCDHEFEHDEPPCEVCLAMPWANREHPALCNAICTQCAALAWSEKQARIQAIWRQLSPGVSFTKMGEA